MKAMYNTPDTDVLTVQADSAQMLPASPGIDYNPPGAPARTPGNPIE